MTGSSPIGGRAETEGPYSATGQPIFISVAVPTCNRPADIARCLASLARVRYPAWEVIVVDQSDGDETRLALTEWDELVPRIVYLQNKDKNLSAARNLAMGHAAGKVIAFIDDDCTVAPDWLDTVGELFAQEAGALLVFGAVNAAQHDSSSTFITTVEMRDEQRLRGSLSARRVRGMGASMYLRPSPGTERPFDVLLGAGARFRSGEDHDYAFRLLASGGTVVQTPRITVTHHGARPYAGGAARSILQNYLYGAGACHAKLVRCGHWAMIATIVGLLAENVALVRPLNAFAHKPTHGGRLLVYLRGVRDGLRVPVDRREEVFT